VKYDADDAKASFEQKEKYKKHVKSRKETAS
jgi:hypothetical protein